MRYAVNVCDLTYDDIRFAAQLLLTPEVLGDPRTYINADGNVDGGAVVLICEEKRAKAICQVLQKKVIEGQGRRVRCYAEGPRGGWKPFGKGKGQYEDKEEKDDVGGLDRHLA